jgi:CarD family transcriptional regulator
MSKTSKFSVGERVVYPSHGVGEIINIEEQNIGDIIIQVYVVFFTQEKMTLKVPLCTAHNSGLRKLSTKEDIAKIHLILQSKPKQGNRMWSRRAQEYTTKINSGDVIAVAEVVRDLYKNVDNDRSYSERTIYESALHRLAGEIAILENTTSEEVIDGLIEILKDKVAA